MAENAYSLVQAAYEPNLHPLAIYEDETMAGMILYDYDEAIPGWSFSRYMIAHPFQGKGYGKQALQKFLAYFDQR